MMEPWYTILSQQVRVLTESEHHEMRKGMSFIAKGLRTLFYICFFFDNKGHDM